MKVEIWSDVVCPWCYLGSRRWAAALERFPHADQVETVWRAFELRTDAPKVQGVTLTDLMGRRGLPPEQVTTIFARIRGLGQEAGIDLRPGEVRPVNSFDAHRLLGLASGLGAGQAMADRLFRAYHSELLNIADHTVLAGLAADAGLPAGPVAELLAGDDRTAEVRAEEARAAVVGVTAVPSFVLDGRPAVSGALDTDELLALLTDAWEADTARV
ncbi:DsbA family protein [Kitasatospora indigofera]|uniref:DSBA oxidoreductase n=1 Tax=Kitasatospora indigofera TaxID=67307 RepID=A0A919FQP9_9ACTN|nr:DsbA family oxidoreductase [Kitasatospora indigofera]GHH70777.1 DSBA oxidoreductase [Kitasatospora indigofera]